MGSMWTYKEMDPIGYCISLQICSPISEILNFKIYKRPLVTLEHEPLSRTPQKIGLTRKIFSNKMLSFKEWGV